MTYSVIVHMHLLGKDLVNLMKMGCLEKNKNFWNVLIGQMIPFVICSL